MRIRSGWLVAFWLSLVALFTSAVRASPDSHEKLGMKAFAKGDFLKASEELAAALEIHPDEKVALYLGNAYLQLGQLGKAKTALERVLLIDPTTPRKETIIKLVNAIASRNVGVVQLTSTPAGATVYVNNKSEGARGKTPFELSLPPGTHRLVFELDGYAMGSADVTIKFGETTELDLPLQALSCELSLSSIPVNGSATINAANPIALPVKIRVAPGDHRIIVSGQGYRVQKHTVHCDGAKPLAVEAALVALPAQPTPVGAQGSASTSDDKQADGAPSPPPGPLPSPPRVPIWRLATGIVSVAAGAVLIGIGAPSIAMDGLCADQPLVPGVACSHQFQSLATGAAVTSVGGILAVTGTVLLALPPRTASGQKR